MKNKIIALGVLFLILMSTSIQSFAQGDMDELLNVMTEDYDNGRADATTLLEGYMNPLMHGLGLGMNNGWFGTAASHKSFGMDIGFVTGLAFIPDSDLSFRPTNMNLLEDANEDLPTIFGSNTVPQPLRLKSSGTPIDMIPGIGMKDEIGFNAVPYIVPQVGIGIYKGTDIKFRFLPEITIGDNSKLGLIGFGVLHDVKQHIPGIKLLPFDLSVMVGYTKITFNTDLADPNTGTVGNGDISFNNLVYQAMISKKISVITFYGGLGFSSTKSSLDLLGEYDIDKDNEINLVTDINSSIPLADLDKFVDVKDPVSLSFKKGTPKFTAGFRLKFAVLTLNFDYSVQKYQSFNMGFGFSFRENDGGTL